MSSDDQSVRNGQNSRRKRAKRARRHEKDRTEEELELCSGTMGDELLLDSRRPRKRERDRTTDFASVQSTDMTQAGRKRRKTAGYQECEKLLHSLRKHVREDGARINERVCIPRGKDGRGYCYGA
jgi:hypothetical protein